MGTTNPLDQYDKTITTTETDWQYEHAERHVMLGQSLMSYGAYIVTASAYKPVQTLIISELNGLVGKTQTITLQRDAILRLRDLLNLMFPVEEDQQTPAAEEQESKA